MTNLKHFGRKVMNTKSGTWFEITDKESAKIAGRASQTAIGHFYSASSRPKAPHHWYYLIEDIAAENPKSPVCLAAVPADLAYEGRMDGLDACHVTGFRNDHVYFEYEDELQALAKAEGIHMVPNHMGRPSRRKTDLDIGSIAVESIADADIDQLNTLLPEGLTLDASNWEADRIISILDADKPIAILHEEDEYRLARVELPTGLENAQDRLGEHPVQVFESMRDEARRLYSRGIFGF
jgi:hypothetical protein